MSDKITISTLELFQLFPDAESARVYLESRLWPTGARCPVCGLSERITTRKGCFVLAAVGCFDSVVQLGGAKDAVFSRNAGSRLLHPLEVGIPGVDGLEFGGCGRVRTLDQAAQV